MTSKKQIEIADYQDWMLDQVVELNVKQYGGDPETRRSSFQQICDDPFVSGKSVPVVALDGDTVVGVQTYRYWPYVYLGKEFYSLQSGGTLVKATHRGQGLFMRMLFRGNDLLVKRGVDFVMGFPVQMSFGGFIKDGWTHLCSPTWFVKAIRPAQLIMQKMNKNNPEADAPIPACFEERPSHTSSMKRCLTTKSITLSTSREFLKYRYGDAKPGNYLFWNHHDSEAKIVLVCKMSWAHGYHELLVGDVLCDSENPKVMTHAFSRFLTDVRKGTKASAVSMLVGGRTIEWLPFLLGNGFVPIPKRIKFIVKNIGLPAANYRDVEKRINWSILGSDLDTW